MQLPGPATAASTARALHPSAPRPRTLATSILEDIACGIAAGLVPGALDGRDAALERGAVRRHLVLATDAYDAWVMVWGPHASTDAHDHDGSIGVVHVAQGRLVEVVSSIDPAEAGEVRELGPATTSATGAIGAHVLTNPDDGPVVAVSVYSPPLGHDA